jgi:hypothetical protein
MGYGIIVAGLSLFGMLALVLADIGGEEVRTDLPKEISEGADREWRQAA